MFRTQKSLYDILSLIYIKFCFKLLIHSILSKKKNRKILGTLNCFSLKKSILSLICKTFKKDLFYLLIYLKGSVRGTERQIPSKGQNIL